MYLLFLGNWNTVKIIWKEQHPLITPFFFNLASEWGVSISNWTLWDKLLGSCYSWSCSTESHFTFKYVNNGAVILCSLFHKLFFTKELIFSVEYKITKKWVSPYLVWNVSFKDHQRNACLIKQIWVGFKELWLYHIVPFNKEIFSFPEVILCNSPYENSFK